MISDHAEMLWQHRERLQKFGARVDYKVYEAKVEPQDEKKETRVEWSYAVEPKDENYDPRGFACYIEDQADQIEYLFWRC